MKNFLVLYIALMLGGLTHVANAMPMIETDACVNNAQMDCITGITDLEVGASVFNVVFEQRSFNEIWGTDTPTFWGSQADAIAAMDALRSFINGLSFGGAIVGYSTLEASESYLDIPYQDVSALVTAVVRGSWNHRPLQFAGGVDQGEVSKSEQRNGFAPEFYDVYAVFTPVASEVPVPATLALFAVAMLGLRIGRRKVSA